MSEDGGSTLPALEGLLAVIAQGPLTGSNKLMLILALIDLAPLVDGDFMSYDAIAGQMLRIGLEQTSPFEAMVLRQVTSRNRDQSVVTAAIGLECALQGLKSGHRDSLPQSVSGFESEAATSLWLTAVKEVRRDAIRNPIRRLQEIDGHANDFLYTRGPGGITLSPGSREMLIRYAVLLRSLTEARYIQFVKRCNKHLEGVDLDMQLREHLFAGDRVMPPPRLRREMAQLQGQRCVYTGNALPVRSHVDHVLPWARTRASSLDNLIVTSVGVNSRKGDRLLGPHALERLLAYLEPNSKDLAELAKDYGWSWHPQHTYGGLARHYTAASPQVVGWDVDGRTIFDAGAMAACLELALALADLGGS